MSHNPYVFSRRHFEYTLKDALDYLKERSLEVGAFLFWTIGGIISLAIDLFRSQKKLIGNEPDFWRMLFLLGIGVLLVAAITICALKGLWVPCALAGVAYTAVSALFLNAAD